MSLFLAGTTILAGMGMIYLAIQNGELHTQVSDWRERYSEVVRDCIKYKGEAADFRFKLDEFLHPTNRGMTEPIDAEEIIANSDDPVWKLVADCYDLKPLWELRTPGEAAKQPHQQYADFATFILNLPEGEQHREGIAKAIACLDAPPTAEPYIL